MTAPDAYEDGSADTRQEFTANDFRIMRALDSLLASARAIRHDDIAAADIVARLETLRHLLKQVGHDV